MPATNVGSFHLGSFIGAKVWSAITCICIILYLCFFALVSIFDLPSNKLQATFAELNVQETTLFGNHVFVMAGVCPMGLCHQMWRLLDWSKLVVRRACSGELKYTHRYPRNTAWTAVSNRHQFAHAHTDGMKFATRNMSNISKVVRVTDQFQDRRFLSFSKGCHLGLRREVSYSAVVTWVHGNTVDVRYTNPSEWADGASGFTNSLGSSLKEAPVEADVNKSRVTVLPDSKWYWNFWQTWERGELPRTSMGDFLFPPQLESGDSKHLKLADAFADTERGHLFRVNLLAEEKEMLHEDFHKVIDSLVTDASRKHRSVPAGWLWPRQPEMAMAKRLFLKLLRTPFWTKWIERGGESPSKVTTLFGKKKFVRLVLRWEWQRSETQQWTEFECIASEFRDLCLSRYKSWEAAYQASPFAVQAEIVHHKMTQNL